MPTLFRATMALLVISALAGASPPTTAPEVAGRSRVTYMNGADSSGWISFEIRGGHLFLSAVVNGRTVPALLDSGASVVVVNAPEAARLGIAPSGRDIGTGVGGAVATDMARDVSISVGNLRIDAREVALADNRDLQKRVGYPFPVVLGGEFFRETVIDIDFARRRLAFRRPDAVRIPPASQTIALYNGDDLRTVRASIEGRAATMLFDLGNGSAVYLHPRFWQRGSFLSGRRVTTTLAGGFTGATPQKLVMLRTVSVGGTVFADLPATLRDSSVGGPATSDGNIGLPIWSRFHLLVDFPHNRLILGSPTAQHTPFAVDHTGLSLRMADGGRQIDFVASQSPAWVAGFKKQDVIAEIVEEATGKVLPLTGAWRTSRPGTKLQLRLSDGRVVQLVTARYF